MSKYSLDDLREVAKRKNGKCLSKKYNGVSSKYKWECKFGHNWYQTFHQVRGSGGNKGTWCPDCSGNQRLSIKDAKLLAKKKSGKCISKEYKNARTYLVWECHKGHRWKATYSKIKVGKWCPLCAGNARGSIEKMQRLASNYNGHCLSKNYINSKHSLTWKCEMGHKFRRQPVEVSCGKWCRQCTKSKNLEEMRLGIEVIKTVVEKKGGTLLTKRYRSITQQFKVKCGNGHTWETSGASLKYAGSWCPECQRGLKERICRVYFESIFKAKFPEERNIEWLISSSGAKMTLDGYNKKLGIAFEHQGEQHYTTKTHFISNSMSLKKRKVDDEIKVKECRNNKVKLFVIPSLGKRLEYDQLLNFIKDESKRLNVPLPQNIDKIKIPLKKAYNPNQIDLAHEIVKERGGILSSQKMDVDRKFKIKCSKGHSFRMSFKILKRGAWCPKCALSRKGDSQRLSLEDCIKTAKDRGGQCLSDRYVNSHSKMKWECKEGHIWSTTYSSIRSGRWCRECATKVNTRKQKHTIKDMKELASSHGGKFLSKEYVNSTTSYEWECKNGHRFFKRPTKVRSGKNFCSYCAGNGHLVKG